MSEEASGEFNASAKVCQGRRAQFILLGYWLTALKHFNFSLGRDSVFGNAKQKLFISILICCKEQPWLCWHNSDAEAIQIAQASPLKPIATR